MYNPFRSFATYEIAPFRWNRRDIRIPNVKERKKLIWGGILGRRKNHSMARRKLSKVYSVRTLRQYMRYMTWNQISWPVLPSLLLRDSRKKQTNSLRKFESPSSESNKHRWEEATRHGTWWQYIHAICTFLYVPQQKSRQKYQFTWFRVIQL